MAQLFSYGTLQDPAVQLKTFGRHLAGRRDALPGYARVQRGQFFDAEPDPGATLDGTLFEVTDEEALRVDAYEAADGYHRVAVSLRSGVRAWIYVHAD